jgi:hypothetical protein
MNYLPGLPLNHDPADLCRLSHWCLAVHIFLMTHSLCDVDVTQSSKLSQCPGTGVLCVMEIKLQTLHES